MARLYAAGFILVVLFSACTHALSNSAVRKRVVINPQVREQSHFAWGDAPKRYQFPSSKRSALTLSHLSATKVQDGGSQSLASIATLYRRVSWVSWWFQVILSVIGGVILTFANTVRKGGSTYALWSSGFAFSGIGAISALLNAFWTWNITRTTRRVAKRKIDDSRVVPTLRRLSKISVTVSLLGMVLTLFAAEQIVGTLASKVLSSQGLVPTLAIGTQLNQIQALDIFLVQANTNILVAHYVPLVAYLWLQTQLPPPPSQSPPQQNK